MQAYCKDLQVLDINGQFGKLTDRKEIPVPELAEGGPRSFVRNELRMCKPTLNDISCLTSLKRKRRNNV